jgi:selenoprotein W-related protein
MGWHSTGLACATITAVATGHRVEIEYCTGCRFLSRASWIAQELLTTFEDELDAVALVPGSGGILEVRVDGEPIWSRGDDGAAIDPKVIKRRVRDLVAPDRGLGHTDRR